jgi:hypothetical protein
MRGRAIAGGVLASMALVGFAATGLGDDADESAVEAATVDTRRVSAPSEGAPMLAKGGQTLFKVIYKESDPTPVGTGARSVTIDQCPRGAGVLNGYYSRTGLEKTGIEMHGGTPTGNVRSWVIHLNNTTGTEQDVVFGLVCIK